MPHFSARAAATVPFRALAAGAGTVCAGRRHVCSVRRRGRQGCEAGAYPAAPGGNVAVRKLYRRTCRLIRQYVMVFSSVSCQTARAISIAGISSVRQSAAPETTGQRGSFSIWRCIRSRWWRRWSADCRASAVSRLAASPRAGYRRRARKCELHRKQNSRLRRARPTSSNPFGRDSNSPLSYWLGQQAASSASGRTSTAGDIPLTQSRGKTSTTAAVFPNPFTRSVISYSGDGAANINVLRDCAFTCHRLFYKIRAPVLNHV